MQIPAKLCLFCRCQRWRHVYVGHKAVRHHCLLSRTSRCKAVILCQQHEQQTHTQSREKLYALAHRFLAAHVLEQVGKAAEASAYVVDQHLEAFFRELHMLQAKGELHGVSVTIALRVQLFWQSKCAQYISGSQHLHLHS